MRGTRRQGVPVWVWNRERRRVHADVAVWNFSGLWRRVVDVCGKWALETIVNGALPFV
jgi:hypothetical protein